MTYTLLVGGQLKQNKTYYNFGKNFENKELKNQFKNVTVRKRKLLPIISEDRLADCTKKIESAKEIFSNIIKQTPPESYKKFKIDYGQLNNINIGEVKYESDDEFTN